jgi:hypothetical protein
MTLLLPRLLLFLLLVCDWVGDPHHGQSPLSRPWSSQEVSCHSLAHQPDNSSLALAQRLLPDAPAVLDTPQLDRPGPGRQKEARGPSRAGAELLYAFMSLRL